MKIIKYGDVSFDAIILQWLLNNRGYELGEIDGWIGNKSISAIKKFQEDNSLVVDGVVGKNTWDVLTNDLNIDSLSENDYISCAEYLNVDLATIKAVKEVESGKLGGYVTLLHPPILFEGHVLWRQLKKRGINPEEYEDGYSDVLYPKWVKNYYKGGIREYDRLDSALEINCGCSLESASWGMFQLMGYHWSICGYDNVNDFVKDMVFGGERKQLEIFAKFIKANKLDIYLRELNWVGFAYKYNGPGYKQNNYDIKLEKAYNKYKKTEA